MIREELTDGPSARRAVTGAARMLLALKLDGPLLVGLGLIAAYGLVVLYSASGQSLGTVIRRSATWAWARLPCWCWRRSIPTSCADCRRGCT